MSHQGSCSSQPAGDHSEVLVLDGDFDRANAAQLQLALDKAIGLGRAQLVVDLRDVSFLDSTILRMLIHGDGQAVAHGGQFALIRQRERMESVRAHRFSATRSQASTTSIEP